MAAIKRIDIYFFCIIGRPIELKRDKPQQKEDRKVLMQIRVAESELRCEVRTGSLFHFLSVIFATPEKEEFSVQLNFIFY